MPRPAECVVHNLREHYQLIWLFFLVLPLNSSKNVHIPCGFVWHSEEWVCLFINLWTVRSLWRVKGASHSKVNACLLEVKPPGRYRGEQAKMLKTCPVKLHCVQMPAPRGQGKLQSRLGRPCRSLPLARRRLPSGHVGAGVSNRVNFLTATWEQYENTRNCEWFPVVSVDFSFKQESNIDFMHLSPMDEIFHWVGKHLILRVCAPVHGHIPNHKAKIETVYCSPA